MKIRLPDFDLSPFQQVPVNGTPRYATATAVKFVDENTLLAAQLLNRMIHVVDIATGEVTFSARTEGYIDLLDYRDGMIVTAEYPLHGVESGLSMLLLDQGMLTLVGRIELPEYFAHGVHITDYNTVTVCSTNEAKALFDVDLRTGEVSNVRPTLLNAKDVAEHNGRLVLIQAEDRPGHDMTNGYAEVGYYGGVMTAFWGLPEALCIHVDRAYVTYQDRDFVAVFKIIGDRFIHERTITADFTFPHGCDVLNGRLAVSNYGDNSISLIDL